MEEQPITNTRRIAWNAVSAVAQVVVIGLIYFFLYSYLVKTLGVKELGVWALVLSTSSVATLANFGITSGLVKFVADYKAMGEYGEMSKLIFTAFIAIVMFFTFLIAVAYVVVWFIISHLVEKQFVALAIQILPYSLLCLFINEVGGVFTSILEGFQRNYLRNLIYIVAAILFLAIAIWLVPKYGLVGVAYAQVVQSVLITISAYFFGSRLTGGISILRWNWDKKVFKALIGYGSKFQVISLLQLLYEPTTKALLTRFGGLPAVGFYEMATRLVNQVRALIVNANQVMVPVMAEASHQGMSEVRRLYARTMSATLFIDAPLIAALICFGPFISRYWIGHLEPRFVFPLNVLAIAMFFNIICGPAFFSSLGEGKLRLLVWINILMAVLNVSLGLSLGLLFKGDGVILSWGTTYGICSVLLVIYYQRNIEMNLRAIFSSKDLLLFVISLIVIMVSLLWPARLADMSLKYLLINGFFFTMIVMPVMLANNNAKSLLNKIFKR